MDDGESVVVQTNEIAGGLIKQMLEKEKWSKAKEIFQNALPLPFAERLAFVENESEGDGELQKEIATLLKAHEEAGDFIDEAFLSVADFVENPLENSRVGEQIGLYKIEKEIGRGGMGTVYLAVRADQLFDKKVAVKLIKRGFDTDEIIKRFQTERRILAGLDHPYITRLIDGGASRDGLPYLVMDYVQGASLTEYVGRQNLSIKERLELFLKICSAMRYAHQNLIIHRDLKPSNVLVTEDGTPKLLDFGIAKLIADDAELEMFSTVTRVMTPEYASPEQVSGKPITTATDVYSLGVILYELLAGKRPFQLQSKGADEVSKIITDREPLKPSSVSGANPPLSSQNRKILRGDLDNIVLIALRKEPERRYSSVEQFAADIERYLKGLPVIAREDSFLYRTDKFVRRNKVGVGAVGAVAFSLVAGMIATARQTRIARKQSDKASKINKFLQKMLSSADPRAVGKDARVVEVLKIAADSIEKDFAGSPEIVADLRSTIGLTFLSVGQIESAEPHLAEALKIRCNLFGSESGETAVSLNDFGKLLQAKGDLKAAEKYFRQSLAVLRNIRDASLETAAVLGNLGYLLLLQGNHEESKSLHHEKLEIISRVSGETNAEFAQTLSSLANVYSVTGDKLTAEMMHRQALRLTRRLYGNEHPDTATAMLHLAITIIADQPTEAESLFHQTLESRRKFFGAGHIETAWAIYYTGDVFLRRKDYRQAIECANEILSWRGNSIPETHSVISSTLLLMGRCHLLLNSVTAAESYFRECLLLRKATLPFDHWLIASAEGYLADCLLVSDQSRQAAYLFQKSYQTLLDKLGENHEHTRLARKRLAGSNRN